MADNLSKKKLRMWDYGLFTSIAQALGPLNDGFGTVELYVPWMDPFPTPERRWVGRNLPGITRIWDFWEDLDSVDTFLFADVGDASEQQELRRQGRAVFGTGGKKKNKAISEMEIDRELFKRTLLSHNLAVPKWKKTKGIDTLRQMAKEMPEPFNEGFWVKPNVGERGVFETFFVESYKSRASKFDQIAHDLGVSRDVTEFMIEERIPGVEPGSDFFVCKGVPFDVGLYGSELKGDAYSSVVMKLADMPKPLRMINDAMLPVWKEYEIDGAMSTEIRVGKDKKPFFLDICSRFGNPPAGCISTVYENFSHVVRGIAHGEVVRPEFRADYVAEISVEAADACTEPIPFEFKEKDWMSIKLRTACRVEGNYYHIPFPKNGSTIVKAVGIGDSREEAEYAALESAESFKCPGKSFNRSAFEELEESIKEGIKYGLAAL